MPREDHYPQIPFTTIVIPQWDQWARRRPTASNGVQRRPRALAHVGLRFCHCSMREVQRMAGSHSGALWSIQYDSIANSSMVCPWLQIVAVLIIGRCLILFDAGTELYNVIYWEQNVVPCWLQHGCSMVAAGTWKNEEISLGWCLCLQCSNWSFGGSLAKGIGPHGPHVP